MTIDEVYEALRSDERKMSEAYVRLRALIPGAFRTPHAPTARQVWEVTERALLELRGYLPMDEAPRDGREIMLRTRIGEVSARYDRGQGWTETMDGREYEGPSWVCYDAAFTIDIEETPDGEVCDALGWRTMPEFVT